MTASATRVEAEVAQSSDEQALDAAIRVLGETSRRYAAEYFGHFLNEHQIDAARTEVAEMGTASAHLYDLWQRNRSALPTSSEIGRVVEPPTFRSQISRWRPSEEDSESSSQKAPRPRFTRLVQLNERVRRTTEAVTEALPVMRDQILYARHFERNCMRLYGNEEVERLRDAEDMRLTLEQTLRAIQGDVDSLRAQTQSLTLYAQMHLAIQVQVLTWIILFVTIAGVVAAFVNR